MGKFAVTLLLDRIKNGHSSVITMEFEGQLKIRESCYDLNDSNMAYRKNTTICVIRWIYKKARATQKNNRKFLRLFFCVFLHII